VSAVSTPRPVCARCLRPSRVCYCAELPSIATPRVRLLLLQHPRERDVAIGTARMASLCLPDAELLVGADWSGNAALDEALSDPARPSALLYPGEGARDIARDPPRDPVTLVVIDGTWANTKKMLRRNPRLAALPRWTFVPPAPSEYRIRREPSAACVSTIEALAHVLGVLHGDAARFAPLMRPFRFMVDTQIAHAATANPRDRRAPRKPKPLRDRVPRLLVERASDVVVVAAEANAWPYWMRAEGRRDELVHWVACRPQTGETFAAVVAPREELAPSTCQHIGISAHRLASGLSLDELHARWRAFVRPRDVVATWGAYAPSLFEASGGVLPSERVDLRAVAHAFFNARLGTLADFAARCAPFDARAEGRAGLRAAHAAAIARHFASL